MNTLARCTSSSVVQTTVSTTPLDRTTLAEWSEAVRFRYCSFEYTDIAGGHWSVEREPGTGEVAAYLIYNHQLPGKPGLKADILEVARVITSYVPGCPPANVWGSIGAHPWRAVSLSSIHSVMEAADQGRITGEFGEALPSPLPRILAHLLLCCISPDAEAALIQLLDAGETVTSAWKEIMKEPDDIGGIGQP